MDAKQTDEFWLRLDNAAKIYPAIQNEELTSVFRITAVLNNPVKAKEFLAAVHAIEDRFPYYKVRLKAGLFWYYLEHHNLPMTVVVDSDPICRAFGKTDNLFRVLVKGKAISVEFSHILTDAAGAFEFMKVLLFTYFEECGFSSRDALQTYRLPQVMAPEEYEDAFNHYFQKTDSPTLKVPGAFHLQFNLSSRFRTVVATMPVDEIMQLARESEVSLTNYLTAVYIYVLQDIYENLSVIGKRQANKYIRIQVPVNLRKIFPTKSMRNFSLYVLPEIDTRLGHYSFEEILKTVYHQMQLQTDKKLIHKMMARNVGGEKKAFIRILPLCIKSFVLEVLYALGSRRYSGVVTNFGKIELPETVSKHISDFIIIPPPPNQRLKVNLGVCGFQQNLILGFGSITESRELEKRFLRFLTAQGVAVKIHHTTAS